MSARFNFNDLDVGYDIPAAIGMDEAQIQTPCLVIDLDALEHNIKVMRDFIRSAGVRHRLHGKMHKSVDIARYQIEQGDAYGVCCQKVSEAEVFVRAGISDVLVTNQIRDPIKIDRLVRLPKYGVRTICCVDEMENVAELSEAAARNRTQIEVLVEIHSGAGRCGVKAGLPVVDIARAVDAAEGLKFSRLQAYQGEMQHLQSFAERKNKIDIVIDMVRQSMGYAQV